LSRRFIWVRSRLCHIREVEVTVGSDTVGYNVGTPSVGYTVGTLPIGDGVELGLLVGFRDGFTVGGRVVGLANGSLTVGNIVGTGKVGCVVGFETVGYDEKVGEYDG
jgi:hypothetical protein